MLCNQCGQTLQNGLEFCPNCGTAVEAVPENAAGRSGKAKSVGFFSFGTDLFDLGESGPAADLSAVKTSRGSSHTCAVCAAQASTHICPDCGFDSSCHYEQYPTLQHLSMQAKAVSALKAQWEASAETPVEQAISFLRRQGWAEYVLSAVEEILRCAQDGLFTEQYHVEICENLASDEDAYAMDFVKPLPKLSKFCAVCGTSNDSSWIYCLGCGVKLNAFSAKRAAQKEGTGQQWEKGLNYSKFCPQCGGNVLSGTSYCTLCGEKIE